MRANTHSVGDSRHMRANTHSAGNSRHMRANTHSVGNSRHMRDNTHSVGDSRHMRANTHSVGDSRSTHPSRGLDAVDDANQACSIMYLHGCEQYLALATQFAKPTFDPRSLDLPTLEHLLVSIMRALGSPSSKRGSMLRRRVTATLLTASHILTLRDIAPTPMKRSWVI